MLNLAKSSPLALRSAAKSQLEKGQPQQAQAYVMEALSRDVNDHEALALLADSYAFQGMKMEAFSFFTLAVCAAPEVLYYKERFIVVATTIAMERYNETAERAILECLKTADVLDEAKLRTVWLSHLLTMPDMVTQYNIAGLNNHALATTAAFKNISDLKPLLNAFFLTGIRKFVIFRPAFEEFMSYVRKHLLDDYLAGHKKLSTDEFVTLASAVAQYSFNSDYILEETPDDLKKSEDLRARVEVGDVNTATIALLACYTPLFKLKNRKDLQATFATHADLGAVVKKQISDFENLHDIAKTIEAITPIDDAISLEVQKQYEEFPYPRWESLPDQSMLRGWKMSRQEQEIVGARVSKKGVKILIAGCGTGLESVLNAVTFKDAQVLAIDLSRSSIAYAMNKVKEFGLTNVTFKQADILNLGMIEEKFDYIVSGGVLHHIQDPVKAWGVLCGLLKDDGLMMVALYSKVARERILRTRQIIQDHKINHDAASMKEFRKKSPTLLDPLDQQQISIFADYYYLNMYRDMLFHVQEHDYDLPELAGVLKQLKLKFLRFAASSDTFAKYAEQFPDDIEMTNLDNWNVYEQGHKDTFIGMYAFWCKKDNEGQDS